MSSESAIASVSFQDILATVAAATMEERAELARLLAPAKKEVAKVEKEKVEKVVERLSEEVLGAKPELPEEEELDEDFCHARVGVKLAKEDIVDSDKDDWLGRSSGLKFGGFRSKIFLEQQCTNKPSAHSTLCSGCAKKFEKHQEPNKKGKVDLEAWTAWNGIIGEAPPTKNRYIGSEYSKASYEAWGEAPRSGPSSAKKSSAGSSEAAAPAPAPAKKEVKVEPKKEVKVEPKKEVKVEVKVEPKKEVKPKVAAVVAPPVAPVKKVEADLYFNAAMDCFIDLEGKCFYADLDEATLNPIPDMDRMIGTIPKEMDRKKATEADFTPSEETERAEEE